MFQGSYCLCRRTVSSFLASDFREKIDKILISREQKRLQVEINHEEEEEDSEEWMVECSARYQEKLEEDETEKVDLESVTISDISSQSSMMMTWSFGDGKAAAPSLSVSSNHLDRENISSYVSLSLFWFVFLGQ